MGDPNASIRRRSRRITGRCLARLVARWRGGAVARWRGGAVAKGSLTFVSQAALAADIKNRFDLAKTLRAVKSIRGMRKQHMIHNHCLPKMEIDAQTYPVRADDNS